MSKKEEILNNLMNWTLENSGNFSTYSWPSKKTIKLDTKGEKEIRETIIEKIRQNPDQWRIEKLNTSYRDGPYPYGASMRNFYYDTFLIHQSAKIKLISKENRKKDKEKMLSEVDFGKMHYKRGFADTEWTKIESILNNNQNNIPLEEWLEKDNKNKPNSWNFKNIAIFSIVGVIALLGLIWLVNKIKNWTN